MLVGLDAGVVHGQHIVVAPPNEGEKYPWMSDPCFLRLFLTLMLQLVVMY
jgi:hypothetical protein